MPRGWRALLASVLLVAIAYPPFGLVVPSLVALAPFAVWIAGRPSGREAFRGGLWFGIALWLVLLRWLPVTLGRFLPTALPGWLLVVLALGLVTAGVAWTAWHLHYRVRLPLWLALPVAWTAGEWFRAHLPGSLAFPWLELAVSLAGTPELLGIAELVGGRGVGFVLALVSGLVATAWIRARTGGLPFPGEPGTGGRTAAPADACGGDSIPRAAPHALAAVVVCVAAGGWGVYRATTLQTRPGPVVAIVQTAVPQEARGERRAAAELGMSALERLLPRLTASDGPVPDVVVLPEAVLPVRLERSDAAALRTRVESEVRRAGAPVLLGALGVEAGASGRGDDVTYNSVFLVSPGEGLTGVRYDKRHLVPVVERMPVPGWAGGGDGGWWGSHGTGGSADPIPVGGHRFGVLICLESSFARAARALRLRDADVLVNPTNDAWLNGSAEWTRSSALRQHPAHLVLRAVETRTPAARSANTGLSMFVDPVGRTHQVMGPFREGIETRTLRLTDGLTLFVRLGDVTGIACVLAVLLLPLGSLLRDRTEGFAGTPPDRHPGPGRG